MKRLRMEDPRNGLVSYGPSLESVGDLAAIERKVFGCVPSSLPEAVLRYWVHGFLWGMSVDDRLAMLELTRALPGPVTPWELETVVGELALKGWEDFPRDYARAPIRIVEESEH